MIVMLRLAQHDNNCSFYNSHDIFSPVKLDSLDFAFKKLMSAFSYFI
jgi:hypothetical protein